MTARSLVDRLLESPPDEVENPRAAIKRYTDTIDFDRGSADVVNGARRLYKTLDGMGVIDLLRNYQRRGSLLKGFDDESIAEAVIRLAIERRGTRGGLNAYKIIKRETAYRI